MISLKHILPLALLLAGFMSNAQSNGTRRSTFGFEYHDGTYRSGELHFNIHANELAYYGLSAFIGYRDGEDVPKDYFPALQIFGDGTPDEGLMGVLVTGGLAFRLSDKSLSKFFTEAQIGYAMTHIPTNFTPRNSGWFGSSHDYDIYKVPSAIIVISPGVNLAVSKSVSFRISGRFGTTNVRQFAQLGIGLAFSFK